MSSLNDSGKKRIDTEAPTNLPGFDLASKFITAWSRGMTQQANIYNQNWIKLKSGTLTLADLFSSIGDMWQYNHETLLSLLSAPFPRDNLQWVNFVVQVNADGSLKLPGPQRVDLGRGGNEGTPLKLVGMHVLGKPLKDLSYFDADKTLLARRERGGVKVEINEAGLKEQLATITLKPGETGDFLGMIFDGPSESALPSLIATLRIVGPAEAAAPKAARKLAKKAK